MLAFSDAGFPKASVPKASFPKSCRLRKKREFRLLAKQSYLFKGTSLLISWQRTSVQNVRLGIVVTKKYGNAPVRNRFKRLVREVFRHLKGRVRIGLDCVVRPKGTHELSFAQIAYDFETFFAYASSRA